MKSKNLLQKTLALLCCCATVLSFSVPASAAGTDELIDTTKKGSLNIVKYDMTAAAADGKSESNNISGTQDTQVEADFASYALPGVEFTYVKVADISQMTTSDPAGTSDMSVAVKYTIPAELETALGMTDAQKHADHIYTSTELSTALGNSGNKNTLEEYVKANGTKMNKTNAEGQTSASDLELGLYLVAETSVPAGVFITSNPFFVSLPMTNSNGTSWQYDVWVYPKNQTSKATLDKKVMLAGSNAGYADTTSASIGDNVQYQVVSMIPEVTTVSTYLTSYDFEDTLGTGLTYDQTANVTIEFYDDQALTTKNTITFEKDTDFTVAYNNDKMTIHVTDTGLAKMNPALSTKYMVVTYQATVNANAVLGDDGNDNTIQLTYGRTSASGTTGGDENKAYISDAAKVFTYGILLKKNFSEGSPDATKVKFTLQDVNGNVVYATEENGVYTVCEAGHVGAVSEYSPAADGTLKIRGLKEGSYGLTETATPDGYMLLKESIQIDITARTENSATAEGKNAVVNFTKNSDASAKVNNENASLNAEGNSQNALVKLAVTNNRGFELPKTGGMGTILFTLAGAVGLSVCLILIFKKRKTTANN